MRKVARILCVTAMLFPVWSVASPAGAAGGTTCAITSGTLTFSPALPKLGNPKHVRSTITARHIRIGGCTGGGVTSGVARLTTRFATPLNCATLGKSGESTKGTETITWNTRQTSTLTLTLSGANGKTSKNPNLTGTVKAGLFAGSHESVRIVYTAPVNACRTKGFSSTKFHQFSALTIS